jgi:hypothetical protein
MLDPAATIFSCHHLPQHRIVSTCGWVESCRACRATRWTISHGVPDPALWPVGSRLEVRGGGWCRSYDKAGRLMSKRPIGASVTPL